MVLWIKRRVKVWSETDNVPKRWKNLKQNEHVTTFKKYYLNMARILVEQYGLSWDEKILVQSMAAIDTPWFKGFRTRPKKVFYGTVREFHDHVWEFFREKVWGGKRG